MAMLHHLPLFASPQPKIQPNQEFWVKNNQQHMFLNGRPRLWENMYQNKQKSTTLLGWEQPLVRSSSLQFLWKQTEKFKLSPVYSRHFGNGPHGKVPCWFPSETFPYYNLPSKRMFRVEKTSAASMPAKWVMLQKYLQTERNTEFQNGMKSRPRPQCLRKTEDETLTGLWLLGFCCPALLIYKARKIQKRTCPEKCLGHFWL